MAVDRRKAETREKIALGGLISKAGLAGENPAVLLGLLVEAGARLADDGERTRLRAVGLGLMSRRGARDGNGVVEVGDSDAGLAAGDTVGEVGRGVA